MAINNSYFGGYHSNMIFIGVYQEKNSRWRLCQGVFFAQMFVTKIWPVVGGKWTNNTKEENLNPKERKTLSLHLEMSENYSAHIPCCSG